MQIFLATAMEHQATIELETMLNLVRLLDREYGQGATFLAAQAFPTPDTYLEPRASLEYVVKILRVSDVVVLYYPKRVVSGALVELGYALAWELPTLAMTESLQNLPYMCRGGSENLEAAVVKAELDPAVDAETYFGLIRGFIARVAPPPVARSISEYGRPV